MQPERNTDPIHGHAGALSVQALVAEFHRRHGYPIHEPVATYGVADRDGGDLLKEFANVMKMWVVLLRGEQVAGFDDDLGRQRVSLIAEELGEFAQGCADGDPLEIFDGLCDLNYVVHGSAVVWGMPLTEGTREVHRSNMSKDVGEFKPVKGDDFSEPDLQPLLDPVSCHYKQLELPFPE